MNIQEVKQIRIADYLQSLGYTPVKQQLLVQITAERGNGRIFQGKHRTQQMVRFWTWQGR